MVNIWFWNICSDMTKPELPHYGNGVPAIVVQLKGKHCRKPHWRNGVVDMFGKSPTILCWQKKKRGLELHSIDNFETSFFHIQSYHMIMVFLHDEVYSSWNPRYVWPVVLVSKYTNISLLEEYWFGGMLQDWSQPRYISPRHSSSLERKNLKAFCLLHMLCFVALKINYSRALRCTFFGEWKNLCSSKS